MGPRSSATDLADDAAPETSGLTTGTVEAILAELNRFRDTEADPAIEEEVREAEHLIAMAHHRGLIDSEVRSLRARDAAEAFIGSVIFASPLLVEDGIFAIADHLLGLIVYGVPVLLLLNTVFVVIMTYALVEWTGRDRDEIADLFDVIPIRVVMILVVSFVVAAVLMTVWGRLGDWQSPAEALARINVVWTVGSLGAALGDIISQQEEPESLPGPGGGSTSDADQPASGRHKAVADAAESTPQQLTDGAILEELHGQYDDLEAVVDASGERRDVDRLRQATVEAALDDGFGDRIDKYTPRDIAEAFVGSTFFAIPFLVEDGVFDVAAYFLAFRIWGLPLFFLVNAGFVILLILALVYWAGPQDVRVSRPILGFIPRRLVGIAVVSFVTAAALMTLWGRVGTLADPVVALARVSVVWSAASFGAALGDILPGESSGADINEELASLGETIGE
ncbi:MAG: DUF2391 family protein [Halobacteriales archaeon]